jgi:hypothetical protein
MSHRVSERLEFATLVIERSSACCYSLFELVVELIKCVLGMLSRRFLSTSRIAMNTVCRRVFES